jgi:HEAT repeat protein
MARLRVVVPILMMSGVIAWALSDDGEHVRHVAASLGLLLQFSGAPIPASSATLSEHDLEELKNMPPQDQATRLLEKAINNYKGAGSEIAKRLDSWAEQIHSTPELDRLTETAYFASDLRVRTLALELWLVRDNIRKTPEMVDELIRDAGLQDKRQYFRLSNLGILGNRGIEPEKVFATLVSFVHDQSGDTRAAAINGLGLLGTESTITPLLEIMRWDKSFDLRERAACNLADSGMLTRDLRQKAVPELIRFAQDETLDATTKKWVFQALREIAQKSLPDDANEWVRWHASRPAR